MLHIEDLHVKVGDKEVLHDINLHIEEGETHVLLGPNGSGKTTLLMTIMGFTSYAITNGKIIFKGEDVTAMKAHERAQRGIGMLFQRPPTISGLKLGKMLSAISRNKEENITELARSVHMDKFLERDINKGFSGGEIKFSAILPRTRPLTIKTSRRLRALRMTSSILRSTARSSRSSANSSSTEISGMNVAFGSFFGSAV